MTPEQCYNGEQTGLVGLHYWGHRKPTVCTGESFRGTLGGCTAVASVHKGKLTGLQQIAL